MDNLNPTQPQNDDPIAGALEQVKGWKESGDTEKAIAGCKEILAAAPDNAETKQLLDELEKPTEEKTPEVSAPTPSEAPAETPAPEAAPAAPATETPAPEAAPEATPEAPATETPAEEPKTEETPTAEEAKPEEAAPVETPEVPTEEPKTEEATAEEPKTEETPEVPEGAPALTDTPKEETPKEEGSLYSIDTDKAAPLGDSAPLGAPALGSEETPKKKLPMKYIIIGAAVIVVLGLAGGAYALFAGGGDEMPPVDETAVEDTTTPEDTTVAEDAMTEDTTAEEDITEDTEVTEDTLASRNDQRFLDLTMLEEALEDYYEENHVYPAATDLEGELNLELPTDPMHGQENADGETYGYVYAVYDNELGSNQEYVLSGLFEDEVDGTTLWTTGASAADHPDYHDTSLDNVTMIGEATTATTDEEEPKVKVKR